MTRDQVAYHEAGHVVAAVVLGERFGTVTLDHDGGAVQVPEHGRLTRRRALRIIDVALAGNVADEIYRGARPRPLTGEWSGDLWAAKEATWCSGMDGRPRSLGRIVKERRPLVATVLRKNWPAVQAVARRLLDEGVLTPRKARHTIRRARAADLDGG